ncbi:MAG: nuclear transport factor 2 family protein [Verrucomicrobiota bacterium]|nr:nuclear transport factor 2 family protein [Verrucomicrobiota bacterium]
MTTSEVGKKVVELVRKQAWREAIDTLYGDDVVSVEARGMDGEPEKRGIDAVRAKTEWWIETMQVDDLKVTGPYVAHDRFVVLYEMEFGEKSSKDRIRMSEAGVYTVKDGKIVREEFLPLERS